MTIKELFDEYAELYKFWDKERQSYANPLHIEPGLERMTSIIQEVETLIRKETIEELDRYGLEPRDILVRHALSKGIKID